MLTNKSLNSSQRDDYAPLLLSLYSILSIAILATLYFLFSENLLLLNSQNVNTYLYLGNQQSILDSLVPNILLSNLVSLVPINFIPVIIIKIFPLLAAFLLTIVMLIAFNYRIINPSFSLYFFQLFLLSIAINYKIDLTTFINYAFFLLSILFIFVIIDKLGRFFWVLSLILLIFGIPAFFLGLLITATLLNIFSKNTLPSYLKSKYLFFSILFTLTTFLLLGKFTIILLLALLLYRLLSIFKIEVKPYLIAILFLVIVYSQIAVTKDLNSTQILASNQALEKLTAGKVVKLIESSNLGNDRLEQIKVNLHLSNINICSKDSCSTSDYTLEVIPYREMITTNFYAYYPIYPGYYYRVATNEK